MISDTGSNKIKLRPEVDADSEFLFAVYCSSRRAEVAEFGWDETQQNAFLRMQFSSRALAYKMQFPMAEYSVILFDDAHAGSLIVSRTDQHISLTDIAVLPEYQKNGIGTYVVEQLKGEAARSNRPLVLRVDKTNIAAKEFYERLGLAVTGENQILFEMEWRGIK
ncbi:MAG: GNAT family N-acetyltransferase [Pyrinomonadaceae bacterium]